MKTSTHIKNARQITTHFPKLSNHLQWLTRSPGSGESPLTPSVSPTLCCPASPPPPPPAPPDREYHQAGAQPPSFIRGQSLLVWDSVLVHPPAHQDLLVTCSQHSWGLRGRPQTSQSRGTRAHPDPPPWLRWDRTTSRLLRPAHTQTGVLFVVY